MQFQKSTVQRNSGPVDVYEVNGIEGLAALLKTPELMQHGEHFILYQFNQQCSVISIQCSDAGIKVLFRDFFARAIPANLRQAILDLLPGSHLIDFSRRENFIDGRGGFKSNQKIYYSDDPDALGHILDELSPAKTSTVGLFAHSVPQRTPANVETEDQHRPLHTIT